MPTWALTPANWYMSQPADLHDPPFHPPHTQSLEPLPEPLRGVIRRTLRMMEEQYGQPDPVTRDGMIAMSIRVAIEMALHFDVS